METQRQWSMLELARLAGTTRRTLRHYAEIGLLTPCRIASNGYRYYGGRELLRLQRILLLREMGFGLPAIREVLDDERHDVATALRGHLDWLRLEGARLARQARAVERTLEMLEKGEPLMAEEVLDGFDQTQYREEVERRWGAAAYKSSDDWWRGLSAGERDDFKREARSLTEAWAAARIAGVSANAPESRALALRHVAWLRTIPGTPAHATQADSPELRRYVEGLATMYVEDPRFARNYDQHAPGTAQLVRDALVALFQGR